MCKWQAEVDLRELIVQKIRRRISMHLKKIVRSKNVVSDISKPKHLKSTDNKIPPVKKHLPQSLPREEWYFCSEYIVAKTQTPENLFQTWEGKSQIPRKICSRLWWSNQIIFLWNTMWEHPAQVFILDFFEMKLAKYSHGIIALFWICKGWYYSIVKSS